MLLKIGTMSHSAHLKYRNDITPAYIHTALLTLTPNAVREGRTLRRLPFPARQLPARQFAAAFYLYPQIEHVSITLSTSPHFLHTTFSNLILLVFNMSYNTDLLLFAGIKTT